VAISTALQRFELGAQSEGKAIAARSGDRGSLRRAGGPRYLGATSPIRALDRQARLSGDGIPHANVRDRWIHCARGQGDVSAPVAHGCTLGMRKRSCTRRWQVRRPRRSRWAALTLSGAGGQKFDWIFGVAGR